jgi:hypothetical protein
LAVSEYDYVAVLPSGLNTHIPYDNPHESRGSEDADGVDVKVNKQVVTDVVFFT